MKKILLALALVGISSGLVAKEKASKNMIGIQNMTGKTVQLNLEYYHKKMGTDTARVSLSPNKMVEFDYKDDDGRALMKISSSKNGKVYYEGKAIKSGKMYEIK